ncbi:MAG: ABC transporter permease, partial [Bauldia sp.]
MRIELVKRQHKSRLFSVLSPFLAFALTIAVGAVLFAALGKNPATTLYYYFIDPLTEMWSLHELAIKAAPLILIAVGLSVCFLSSNWNIGAEGQFIVGGIVGSMLPVLFPELRFWFVLPLMLLMGMAGGALYAAIPAVLKVRFNTNEILTSLMLVYVAQLFLDWLARGPWRNPEGHNFPDSRPFDGDQLLPVVFGDNVRLNAVFVLVVVVAVWFLLKRTITGFQISALGQAPRAAAFAGFSRDRMVLLAFLVSGGLAGL